jgi:hypothetical protein
MAVRSERGAGRRRVARGRALALELLARPAALATALYGCAAVAATAPAVSRFGSAFIAGGGPGFGEPAAGDHLQAVYRFWLVGHQLGQAAPPWRDPYSFQPLVEPQLVLAGWPFGLPFWPLEAVFGPIVAWNTLLLACVVGAGLATYAWLRAVGLQPFAAFAGGLVFAVAPYRLAQSGVGHLLGWMAVLIPLALWAFERARRAGPGRVRHGFGALAALALVSIPASGQVHLALGVFPLVLLYGAIRRGREPFLWLLGGAVAGAGIAVALQQTVIESSVLGRGGRTLDQVEMFQADWVGFLDRFGLRGVEQDVYLGWLVPLVALAGLVLLWRRSRWLAVLAAVAVLVPVLLAVGTNLPVYEPIWRNFPPLRYPRVPQRFLPIAELALAGLVALAVGWGLTRLRASWRTAVGCLAVALVVGDLLVFPLRATPADPGNTAYGALAESPAGRTLELPIFEPGIHFGSIYDAYAFQAQRERPSGYSTLAPDPPYNFFWAYNRLNCGAWLPGDEARLRGLGVRYLLFHRGAYEQSLRPSAWFAWQELQRRGYRATVQGGSVWLYPFVRAPGEPRQAPPVPEPRRDEPILCEGWKNFRMKQRDAAMLVHGPARLELDLRSPGPTPATVWVDGERPQRFRVNGTETLVLALEEAGWHVLLFRIPELFDTRPARGLELVHLSSRGLTPP